MPLKNTELQKYIGKPSRASKNISNRNLQIGLECEEQVKKIYLHQGWTFVKQRAQLKFGEIDLIFHKASVVLFIEVKSLHNDWMIFERVKKSQLDKIKRNVSYYQNHSRYRKYQIKAMVVYVNKFSNQINTIEIEA